jgi:GT2 family glycosyltransferase
MVPLAVIPTYLSEPADLEVVLTLLRSIEATTERDELAVLLVDDGSPSRHQAEALGNEARKMGHEFVDKQENEGFSKTVNVGLRKALQEGRDAILVNADMEFRAPGWVQAFVGQNELYGEGPAYVVGARLLYPTGLIQHGGIYFSLLHRYFDHAYKYGPHDLHEANLARVAPVTGALQFIRHASLAEVGLYDERFTMGFEDVDYCLRVWQAGHENVYQPAVWAIHHESMFRGRPSPKVERWQAESLALLKQKWRGVNLLELCPSPL